MSNITKSTLTLLLLSLLGKSFAMDAGAIYEKAINSVVTIVSLDKDSNILMTGTGFYIGNTQLIATNYHVIKGTRRLKVLTSANTESDIFDVCSFNESNDIAILRSTINRPHLLFADAAPRVGDEIAAIGSPMGLPGSLSTGIVGAIRENNGQTLYQITSPISPGSSGGPVLNEQGRVIGMSTFYIKGAQNLNFAIPYSQIIPYAKNTDECFGRVSQKASVNTIKSYAEAFLNFYNENKSSFPESSSVNNESASCAAKLIGAFATEEEMIALTSVFTKTKGSDIHFSEYRDAVLKTLINHTSRNECIPNK